MTAVGHWRRDECDVFVGRGSRWGNPFVRRGVVSKYAVTVVEDPIAAYEAWVRQSPALMAALGELRGKVLGCFCVRVGTPQPPKGREWCHAQVLVRLVEESNVSPNVGVPLRQLVHQYTFDHRIADCANCPLLSRRDETICLSQRPELFNGLMVVGEGPGPNEARLKVPFVGRSGQLLEKLFEMSGLRREETYITNASLCLPPLGDDRKKEKDSALAKGVLACRSRLLTEIEHVQPRVIVALGNYAFSVLTGRYVQKKKQFPLFVDSQGNPASCPECDGEMTMAWWKCNCKHANMLGPRCDTYCGGTYSWPHVLTCGGCGQATQVIKVEPRKKRCPTCGGRKTRSEMIDVWERDYNIGAVAGLVLRGRHAPDYAEMDREAQVDLPCHYLVPSYHPAFLLRQPDKKSGKKKPGGQFMINASLAHFRKVERLLREDSRWRYRVTIVPDDFLTPYEHLSHESPEYRVQEAHALEQTLAALEATFQAALAGLYTSVDIETDSKVPTDVTDIRCIGFHVVTQTGGAPATDAPALVVNTSGLPSHHPIVQRIATFLRDGRCKKVFQNGSYDKHVIALRWGVDVEGYAYDTLCAHNAVHPDEPHDLGHIAGCYTDSPPWKPPKKKDNKLVYESSRQLHRYNGRDVYNTSLSMFAQLAEMDFEKARYVHDLDVAMFHVAVDMERVGLPVDPERWRMWQARAAFYAERALGLLRSFTGKPDFNPKSPPQLTWLLFDRNGPCKLEPLRFTEPSQTHPRGQPSTDKAALLAYKGHPIVELLLDYRRWTGVTSNYMNGMPLGPDWRIRSRQNPLGARTGRWSTGGEEGQKGNLQNWFKEILVLMGLYEGLDSTKRPYGGPHMIPIYGPDIIYWDAERHAGKVTFAMPGIREVIKAPPGRKIVGADLSQAELRVLGALSGDKTLIDKCVNADESRKLDPACDPHAYVCGFAFGEGYTNASKDTQKRLRDLEKRVIYGSFYGAGAETILQSILDGGYEGPPLDQAMVENILRAIFRAFPDVKPWRERTFEEAKRTGKVMDALIGRRREFPLLLIDPTVVYNFTMQSTVASMINMSLWELRHRLPTVDPSAAILVQVHDAIYVECDEDRAEDVAKLVEGVMSQQLQLVPGAPWMPFPASAKIGDDWSEVS